MEYIRKVDFAALAATEDRVTQRLLDGTSGATSCTVSCIKTPPGSGSPEGSHIHPVDQIFYILKGTMNIEVDNGTHECGPGTLVVFPAGVAHRNWNGSTEPTLHLSIAAPLPSTTLPFSTRVE
jgi:quercetin dioxygenase-like cupin family protein